MGDVEVKKKLAAALNAVPRADAERRAAALARPGYLRDVMFEGSKRARIVAAEMMVRVRDAMKILYK